MSRALGAILIFVILGTPLVAYLWATLNDLMMGRIDWMRLGLAVPAIILFMLLLAAMMRFINRMDERPQGEVRSSRNPEP